MTTDMDDILAGLNAERYRPASWWKAVTNNRPQPAVPDEWDNSEATCARRRRVLAEAFAASSGDPRKASA